MANPCERFDEYLAYRSGTMDSEARKDYEVHLGQCEDCRQNKDTMEALLKIMVDEEVRAKKEIEADIQKGRRDLPEGLRRLLQSLRQPAVPRGNVIAFPISRLQPLGFSQQEHRVFALAASDEPETREGYEAHSEADIKVAISISASGSLVANVERSRSPIAHAKIVLMRVTSSGTVEVSAQAKSDANGEAILGKIEDFRVPEKDEHYELKITLPASSE